MSSASTRPYQKGKHCTSVHAGTNGQPRHFQGMEGEWAEGRGKREGGTGEGG